jgi:predicted outer membrane repeat protein
MRTPLICCLLVLLVIQFPINAATIYVDIDVSGGSDDGTSWANAYDTVFQALGSATSNDQIWVAEGQYIEGATLSLVANLPLYGGFTNGMSSLAERDWTAHPALLDGNSAYRVLEGADGAVLDGFIITNGLATRGGGMENDGVSPILLNCTFIDNATSSSAGGAMFNVNSSLSARNCSFVENHASGSLGGAIYMTGAGGTAIFSNCVFVGNSSTSSGGAIYNINTGLVLRNSLFKQNSAAHAGAVYTGGASTLADLKFFSNRATANQGKGGALWNLGHSTIQRCTFAGNAATPSGIAGALYDSASGVNESVIEDCIFSGNRAVGGVSVTLGGAVVLETPNAVGSKIVRRCVFAGNESKLDGGGLYCRNRSDLRLENSLFAGNVAGRDGGGVVVARGASYTLEGARILHCTFAGNEALTAAGNGGALYANAGTIDILASNDVFWGDSSGGIGGELYNNNSAAKLIVGTSDIQGGVGATVSDGGGNIDADPLFAGGPTGTWSSVGAYNASYAETTLTDTGAGWTVNKYRGWTVNPDTSQSLQFVVASNDTDTLYVYGDARTNRVGTAVAQPGDTYRIHSYAITSGSPAIDGGQRHGIAEDIEGTFRPQILEPDMGAYEYRVMGDSTPPANVTGLTATGGQAQVMLSWTNPPNADFVGVLVLRKAGSPPTGVPADSNNTTVAGDILGDGVVVYYGTGNDNTPGSASGWTDTSASLQDETTYFYKVFARDGVPNFAVSPPSASATTEVDTTPPDPVSNLTALSDDTLVQLSWVNPPQPDFAGVLIVRETGSAYDGTQPTDSTVYAPGDPLGDGEVVYVGTGEDATPGASSWWRDTDLTNDFEYFYRVFARDEVPNYSAGVDTNETPQVKNVIYVDRDALGLNNGSSWGNAFSNLQVALAAAQAPTNLWIAEGTYYPGAIRANTFQLKDGVGLIGGFDATETALHQRDVAANATILSGDIDENDTVDDNNSHHVVSGSDDIQLDGITITMGYTVDSTTHPTGDGAGLFFPADTVVSGRIDNCTFEYNSAFMRGAAIYMDYLNSGDTGIIISNSLFRFNTLRRDHTTTIGGAIYLIRIRPLTIIDSVFSDNGGGQTYQGGAIYADDASLHLFGTTFARNVTEHDGGAIYAIPLAPTAPAEIVDCEFFENRSTSKRAGALYFGRLNEPGDVIRRCTFFANRSTASDAGAVYLDQYYGVMENCVFSGNVAKGGGGAIYVSRSHPIMNRVVFAGNYADLGGAMYHVNTSLGHVTISNGLFAGNQAKGQGGAIHSLSGNSTLNHCTFVDNRQTTDTSTNDGGGALNLAAGTHNVHESILYRNRAFDPGDEVYLYGTATLNLSSTDIEGGIGAIAVLGGAAVNDGGGLVDTDPAFDPPYSFGMSGTWTANAVYTNATGRAILTDATASWATDMLVGAFLNPNMNAGNRAYYIAANTRTSITILGGDTNCLAGDAYQILHYSLQPGSTLSGAAVPPHPADDLIGTARPQGAGAELGAYEIPTDVSDPDNVSGLSAVASLDQVKLSWTNPPDEDYRGVLILRREGAAPSGTPSDTAVYAIGNVIGNATVVYIGDGGNLEPGGMAMWTDAPRDQLTTFGYKVCAFDRTPNYASGVTTSATTPLDNDTPDAVTNLQATGLEDDAILTWVNSVSADFAGVLVLRRDGSSPPTGTPNDTTTYSQGNIIGDSQVVYVGPGNSAAPGTASGWTDTGVGNFARYSYCVFAYDEVPLYSASDCDDTITGKANTWFVNDDATGYDNGGNWDDAFLDLQDALTAASSGDEIWMAAGTYYPDSGTDRDATYQLKANVLLYGGFAGGETSTEQRNWGDNVTILSGDIGAMGNHSDNSRNIVTADDADNAVFDGLTVERGSDTAANGPALTLSSPTIGGTSLTIANCVFRNNSGNDGGAVHVHQGSLTLRNTVFRDNTSDHRGSAFYHDNGSLSVVNCVFQENYGAGGQRAVAIYRIFVNFVNCTFIGNGAVHENGNSVYFSEGASGTFKNCILYDSGGATQSEPLKVYYGGGICPKFNLNLPTVTYSLCKTHWSGLGGTGNISNQVPMFVDEPAYDLRLLAGSPCIDTGTSAGAPDDDLDGNSRPIDGDKSGSQEWDMGAYEFGAAFVAPDALIFMIR